MIDALDACAAAADAIPETLLGILGVAVILVVVGFRRLVDRLGTRGRRGFFAIVAGRPAHELAAHRPPPRRDRPAGRRVAQVSAVADLCAALIALGPRLLPGRLRRVWAILFGTASPTTHGSARFGGASEAAAAGHLKPAAPADAFAFGDLPRGRGRFYHDGHILTCAPTGAGKGIGAVTPNLLDYPGSAFVLDLKGRITRSPLVPAALPAKTCC